MRTLAWVTVGMLAFISSLAAAPQPPGKPPAVAVEPAAAWSPSAMDVKLSTVVDYPAELAGQPVRLAAVRVEGVLPASLVELKDAREDGPYHFRVCYRPDRLLAVLPAATKVSRGDVIAVTGTLRTVRGAALTQQMTGASAKQLKHGNRPVLIVTGVTTIDGVSLSDVR